MSEPYTEVLLFIAVTWCTLQWDRLTS